MSEKHCTFCGSDENIRNHHIVPKCKKGKETIPTCFNCENFIHASWTHTELRDTYNSVEAIVESPKFQAFLKWRRKQPATVVFKSDRGKFRDKNKFH